MRKTIKISDKEYEMKSRAKSKEYVYDVIMDCRSENSERYLCPTYEYILIVIKNYIENYKIS